MVDAHALGACGCGRAGSNPASPTRLDEIKNFNHQVRFGSVTESAVRPAEKLTRNQKAKGPLPL